MKILLYVMLIGAAGLVWIALDTYRWKKALGKDDLDERLRNWHDYGK